MFYLILKLLNHKELTNLKGSLEKYQSANKEETFSDELELINLLNRRTGKLTPEYIQMKEDLEKISSEK